MHYEYLERVIDAAAHLPATEADFFATRAARVTATYSLAIEDKYALVLQNFADLELALHKLALDNLLYHGSKWTDHIDAIKDINRLLMNLMTSMKAYLDQTPQHLGAIFAPSIVESNRFSSLASAQYDAYSGYRLIYALRNHAQHGDFPVQSLGLGSQWIGATPREFCAHTAVAYAHRADICANQSLNAKLRIEVNQGPEKIDIRQAICEAMSGFAHIHSETRCMLQTKIEEAEATLRGASSRFEAHAGRAPISLYLVQIDESGAETAAESIFLQPLDRRAKLHVDCATITNMEKHFLSGRTMDRTGAIRAGGA